MLRVMNAIVPVQQHVSVQHLFMLFVRTISQG